MNVQDVLKATFATTNMVFNRYLSDLTDAELLVRPAPGCNHIAWQLGHLLVSNTTLLDTVAPGAAPELPAGFAEKYDAETAMSDSAADFLTKAEYLALFEKLNAATVIAIDHLSESDLGQPSPEGWRDMFPKVGDLVVLIVMHSMMHAGQWVPIRRQLNKPIVI